MRRATIALVMAVSVLPASSAGARSPFAWRGVVGGADGTPGTHGERMRMPRWLAGGGLHAHVHAPKNDLYGRTQWRDAYPAAQQRQFAAEVRLARRLGMQWIPDISPALPEIPTPAPPDGVPSRDLCFSCSSDVNAVVSKFAPFARAGAR